MRSERASGRRWRGRVAVESAIGVDRGKFKSALVLVFVWKTPLETALAPESRLNDD
uniref:Uncharacterized protein n=1 Tax=Peronospora matthiolae TaxID=2874970 RepID=A0AAV1TUP6_9STRA